MKSLLSKYWKRIFIIIATAFICFNVYTKCSAPRNLVSDYAEYGPSVAAKNPGAIIEKVNIPTPDSGIISNESVKIAILIAVLLIGAAVLGDMLNKKPAKKK